MNDHERQAIRDFIATRIAKRKEHRQIGDEDDVIATGIIDSLGIMHLVGYLENNFRLHISDQDLMPENFSSVSAIAAFVSRKRTAAEGNSL